MSSQESPDPGSASGPEPNPGLRAIETVDYHTAGEPFRIIAPVPIDLPGATVAERRARAIADPAAQWLRSVLCCEPRGHADMYGGFVVPPDDPGADLGVLFWHKDGFSTACGHGTIALGAWAVETGLVGAPAETLGGDPADTTDVVTEVVIDVPSGRVTARVHATAGRVTAVDFVNVPSWAITDGVSVPTSRGEVQVAVAFGGAIYAMLPASTIGLAVEPIHLDALIAVGREIKWALDDHEVARHPTDDRLSGIYGTIWYDDLGPIDQGGRHQRNVTIFADGEVDRSPCGSGTSARLAMLAAEGQLTPGAPLRHDSIIGSTFRASIVGTTQVHGRPAILPQVTGMAYRTGEHRFIVDPDDPLVPGFLLR